MEGGDEAEGCSQSGGGSRRVGGKDEAKVNVEGGNGAGAKLSERKAERTKWLRQCN